MQVNEVGDLVLTDPQAMRALAAPGAMALLDHLRRAGPATASELSPRLGETPPEIEERLQRLEPFGFVEREDDRWRAVGRGVYFEIPEDPDGQAAARALSNTMFLGVADLPRRWIDETEPGLGVGWVRAAGLFNARVRLTPDELRDLQEGLEALLAPFTGRDDADVPDEAGQVRVLAFFMPERA
jgi:DNA-binding MarR family transcriptional regulator